MAGLAEWYGKNKRLRELVNLVIVAGYIDPSKSEDKEEVGEIEKMHDLVKKYNLHGQFRWICAQKDRVRNGELYRYSLYKGCIYTSNSCVQNTWFHSNISAYSGLFQYTMAY
eukprot:Gb_12814 [translate_table: standard]